MYRFAILVLILTAAAAFADAQTEGNTCVVSTEISDLVEEAHKRGFVTLRYFLPESVPPNTESIHECIDAVRELVKNRYWLSNGVAACYDRHPCLEANIHTGGSSDWPALYNVIEHRQLDIALQLIDEGVDLNEAGYNGWTPLSRAAQFRMLKLVQALLSSGADPSIPDTFGMVAVDYATQMYAGYRSGRMNPSYLGDDSDRKIDEYRQIIELLEGTNRE